MYREKIVSTLPGFGFFVYFTKMLLYNVPSLYPAIMKNEERKFLKRC